MTRGLKVSRKGQGAKEGALGAWLRPGALTFGNSSGGGSDRGNRQGGGVGGGGVVGGGGGGGGAVQLSGRQWRVRMRCSSGVPLAAILHTENAKLHPSPFAPCAMQG